MDLAGMGSQCNLEALHEIPKELIKIFCCEKVFFKKEPETRLPKHYWFKEKKINKVISNSILL